MTPTAIDLADRIAGVLGQGAPLRLVVLFGSMARGTDHPRSDVDIGIVPIDPQLALRIELDLQARLEHACERPVHLVRLDRASTLLKWKVANEGHPIVNEPPTTWPRFVATSAIEWAEFAPQFHQAEERFRVRVARMGTP